MNNSWYEPIRNNYCVRRPVVLRGLNTCVEWFRCLCFSLATLKYKVNCASEIHIVKMCLHAVSCSQIFKFCFLFVCLFFEGGTLYIDKTSILIWNCFSLHYYALLSCYIYMFPQKFLFVFTGKQREKLKMMKFAENMVGDKEIFPECCSCICCSCCCFSFGLFEFEVTNH